MHDATISSNRGADETRLRRLARRLAGTEVWLVGAAVAASIVMDRLLPYALVVAGVFWLIRWLAFGRPSVRTPADWPLGLLLLMVPVTLWATALPETTRPPVYRLVLGIAFYFALVNWTTTRSRLTLVWNGMVIAGIALAIVAPVAVQWPSGKLPFLPTAVTAQFPTLLGDTINANIMAGTLVVLYPFALAPLLFAWRAMGWGERSRMLVGVLLMGIMLVLTQSRGALIAGGATFGVLVLLRWPRIWPLAPIGAIVGSLAVRQIGVQTVLDQLAVADSISGLEGRLEVWSRALYMIQDFPFTGIGMGTFGPVADILYPFFLVGPDTIPHAHNIFLQVAVDLGIPGLIAWVAIVLLVLTTAWQLYRRGKSATIPWSAAVGAGVLASQAAFLVHGITDAVMWSNTRPGIIMWGIWGIAIAAWRFERGPVYTNGSDIA